MNTSSHARRPSARTESAGEGSAPQAVFKVPLLSALPLDRYCEDDSYKDLSINSQKGLSAYPGGGDRPVRVLRTNRLLFHQRLQLKVVLFNGGLNMNPDRILLSTFHFPRQASVHCKLWRKQEMSACVRSPPGTPPLCRTLSRENVQLLACVNNIVP